MHSVQEKGFEACPLRRRIAWISFWGQLSLAIVSAVVVFFTMTASNWVRGPSLHPSLCCISGLPTWTHTMHAQTTACIKCVIILVCGCVSCLIGPSSSSGMQHQQGVCRTGNK